LDKALDLVRRVGNENLGICVDTWNIFETPSLDETIRNCACRIFVVQISDWRRPRSGADSRSLGEGEIPNARIIETIRSTGYAGPYVLEIFSGESLPDSIWRGDLDATLRKNAQAFESLYGAPDATAASHHRS